jgi:WD40 repeat protein
VCQRWIAAGTGQPRGAPMKHDGAVFGAAFDKSRERILSWSYDGTVRLWDAATGQPRGAPIKHDGAVIGAAFDKSGERILSWWGMERCVFGMLRRVSRAVRQ